MSKEESRIETRILTKERLGQKINLERYFEEARRLENIPGMDKIHIETG